MGSPDVSDEPVSQLVHNLGDELRQLVVDELALAKAELKQSARRGLRVAIAGAVAGVGLSLFLIFALVMVVEWIPNHVLAAAIVALIGLALLAAGGMVVWSNRHLWPFSASKRSLTEDLEWVRHQSKRAHR
ncbi:MAG: phage holin family protein [Candidatus Dormibacteria bacterium]